MALLLRECCPGKVGESVTSNPGPFTGSCLWPRLRASLGAGLGARGAGAGGTATAGPLQGTLHDGLSSPEVRVAAWTAEHRDYTLKTLPLVDTSIVQSHPQYKGVKRVPIWPCITGVNGNDSHAILCGAPGQILHLDGKNSWPNSWVITPNVLALKWWIFKGGFLLNPFSYSHCKTLENITR